MTSKQIVSLYENTEGITVEDIAAVSDGLDVKTIKLALAQGSSKFRKEVKSEEQTFEDEIFEAAKMTMARLMQDAEAEHIQYMASKYIINENKGRHNIQDLTKVPQFNVNLVNVQMERMQKAVAKSLGLVESKPIVELQEA